MVVRGAWREHTKEVGGGGELKSSGCSVRIEAQCFILLVHAHTRARAQRTLIKACHDTEDCLLFSSAHAANISTLAHQKQDNHANIHSPWHFPIIGLVNFNICRTHTRVFHKHEGAGAPSECVQRCLHLHAIKYVFKQHVGRDDKRCFSHTTSPLDLLLGGGAVMCVCVCCWQNSNYCPTEEPGPEKRPDVGCSLRLNNA